MVDFVVLILQIFQFCVLITSQAVPVKVCGSGVPGYDVTNLTSRFWQFKGTHENCLPIKEKVPESCVFYMGLCSDLEIKPVCADSSVCQSSPDNSTFYKLAEYSSDPFSIYTYPPGFTATFKHGQTINSTAGTTCQLQTQINFICNENKLWPRDAIDSVIPDTPVINYIPGKCMYNISFEYAGACLQVLPSTPVTQLSGGTVLIIIFVVTLTVYFTFGSMINIARGEHGKDVVPNADFWVKLPVYVADGFLFACRCGKVPQTDYENI